MQNEFNVLWIDDNKDRRENGRGGVGNHDRINVIPLGPMKAATEFISKDDNESVDIPDPDLALVDWYLHTEDYTGDGPSIEGILRDRFPETPIYAFSSEYGSKKFDREQKVGQHRFALITGPDKLNDTDLIKDLEDYEQIREKEGEEIDGILDLLDAPIDLRNKIQSTLPQEFAKGLPDDETSGISSLRFARWVRHEFLEQAGLLWDETWTATKIGIDNEDFDNYSEKLSNGKYTGIFSHRNDLWWRVRIRDEIYDMADAQTIDRLWKDGPNLLDVEDEHRSSCEVDSCEKKHPPQTVAAGSADEKPSFQVHYSCSNIEQSRASSYEDLRVLVEL